MTSQPISKSTLKIQVYQRLKIWDKKRAQNLKYHMKTIQQISQALEKKNEQSKDFLNSIKTMLEERVNQLKLYCQKSIVDSELVFEKNKYEAYTAHHEVLKQLYNIQADLTTEQYSKYSKLASLLKELIEIGDQDDENNAKNQETSAVISLRGNIKYMKQFELPQIIEKVVQQCEAVSKIYNENLEKDLYLAIDQFIRLAYKQTNKHRQIGQQLISFANAQTKRQISVLNIIKKCLKEWSEIDGPIDPAFIEQLMKNNTNKIVQNFYDISQMTSISVVSVQDFLTNFKMEEFVEHERLKLCEVDGFYNSKIETRILITADCFLHLVRVTANEPDFSLVLNPNLVIKKTKQCNLTLTQYKKKFYFGKEKQYEFSLQLNTQEDLHQLKVTIQKISPCRIQ